MAKILFTILFVCVVVQSMFALCDALDLAADSDKLMDKTKEAAASAADSVKETSKDAAQKIKDAVN